MLEVKASGPPHVLRLWLGFSKGMLPERYFHSINASFLLIECHIDHTTLTKSKAIWPPSVLWILPDLKQWYLSVFVKLFLTCLHLTIMCSLVSYITIIIDVCIMNYF